MKKLAEFLVIALVMFLLFYYSAVLIAMGGGFDLVVKQYHSSGSPAAPVSR